MDIFTAIATFAQSVASVFQSTKRSEKVIDEKAERMDIRNSVRRAKADRKIDKIKSK